MNIILILTSDILLWALICPIGPLKCKKILSSKINVIWVFEISWFPWQPIMPTVKNVGIRTKNTHILTTSHPRLLNMVPN